MQDSEKFGGSAAGAWAGATVGGVLGGPVGAVVGLISGRVAGGAFGTVAGAAAGSYAGSAAASAWSRGDKAGTNYDGEGVIITKKNISNPIEPTSSNGASGKKHHYFEIKI
ncbi:hypothetical protein P4238_26640 [Pseudomonas aeruginosa]|nr:hypothetical protein [Pseudomonas aeruginosa]